MEHMLVGFKREYVDQYYVNIDFLPITVYCIVNIIV